MDTNNNENIEKFIFEKKVPVKKADKIPRTKIAEKEVKVVKNETKVTEKSTIESIKKKPISKANFVHSGHILIDFPTIKPPRIDIPKGFRKHMGKTREEVLAERIPLFQNNERGKKLVKLYEDTKKYFSNIDSYDKCVLNNLMASAHVNFFTRITDNFYPIKEMEKLVDASDVIDKNKRNNVPVLFSDNQEDMLNLFKMYDSTFDYLPDDRKKKLELNFRLEKDNWKGCIFKNIDFKAIEDSVSYKRMFKYIDLENCTLINCKTDNLEYINIPHDKNRFINGNELDLDNNTNSKKYLSEKSFDKFTYKIPNNDNLKLNLKGRLKDKPAEISKGNSLGE